MIKELLLLLLLPPPPPPTANKQVLQAKLHSAKSSLFNPLFSPLRIFSHRCEAEGEDSPARGPDALRAVRNLIFFEAKARRGHQNMLAISGKVKMLKLVVSVLVLTKMMMIRRVVSASA